MEKTGKWPSIDHGLLSPSGKMSQRARKAANERQASRLFPPGYWESVKKAPPSESEKKASHVKDTLRRITELRQLAAHGMFPRKYKKEADRLETELAIYGYTIGDKGILA